MKKNLIEELLGHPGRMISASKGRYRYNNPLNVVIFNSNLCTKGNGKFWYGDIDLSTEMVKLVDIAEHLKKDIYVLGEMSARFENEDKPKYDEAVAIVTSKGELKLKNSEYYDVKDGVPFYKPEEEKEADDDEDNYPTSKYNKDNYKAIAFPEINSFKGTKKASPLDKLFGWFIDKYGKEKAQEMYVDIHWSKRQNKEFKNLLTEYCEKVLKIDGYETQKSVSWASLDTPLMFYGTPEWVKDGYIYHRIKRDE